MRTTKRLLICCLFLFAIHAQGNDTNDTFDMDLPDSVAQPSSSSFVSSYEKDLGPKDVPSVVTSYEERQGGYANAFTSYRSKKSSDASGTDPHEAWNKSQEKPNAFDLDALADSTPEEIKKLDSHSASSGGSTAPVSAKERKELVMRTISQNYRDLKDCYHDGLKKSSEMKGKVVMGWEMDTQGRVSGVEVQTSQLNNKQVEKCMADRLSGWRFPRQAKLQGSKDRMTYTFQFIPETD